MLFKIDGINSPLYWFLHYQQQSGLLLPLDCFCPQQCNTFLHSSEKKAKSIKHKKQILEENIT